MLNLKFLALVLISVLIPGWLPGDSVAQDGSGAEKPGKFIQTSPGPDTPLELQEAWLVFHESNLCQKLDAAFQFNGKKLDVWVVDRDEKIYRKLFALLEPPAKKFRITIHRIRYAGQSDFRNLRLPPPGFLLNSELEGFFKPLALPETAFQDPDFSVRPGSRDSTFPSLQQFGIVSPGGFATGINPSFLYEQRLLMFASDTLKYDTKLKHYAANLPTLARVAFNGQTDPEIGDRAVEVCREHARELQKYAKKLKNNLSKSLPKIDRKEREIGSEGSSTPENTSPLDTALLLSAETRGLSERVYRLLYPTAHTVSLEDLRDPPLLRSVEYIQRIAGTFLDATRHADRARADGPVARNALSARSPVSSLSPNP